MAERPNIENTNEVKHLRVNLIDPDKLVQVNELQEITNPVYFIRNNIPTSDGLFSNEIFGITKYDRANTFAYIDLGGVFINPLIYKMWCKIDSNIKACIHGTKYFIINNDGQLEENIDGDCGIEFLKANIDKIKLKRTNSRQREMRVNFIERYLGTPEMFITKIIVCPPYYRDISNEKGNHTIVVTVNDLYRNLLISVRSLKEAVDYGLNLNDATRGRIQETLMQIYDWFGSGTMMNGEKTPNVIPGKTGILRKSVMTKTTDYASRLVLSAPELKVERMEDLTADLDYSYLPLASACVNFLPFVIYNVRRFFENEFSGDAVIPVINNDKSIEYLHPKDYQEEFSDERIRKEINRFLTGFSNRFIPIEVPTIEGRTVRLRFKGYQTSAEDFAKNDIGKMPIMERDLTWCDILYQAAVESVKDRHIMIARYPIDTYFNQFSTRIHVASTIKTEPMVIGNTFYKNYPYIRQEDIGTNTSNIFVDSLNISNLYLDGIGGDYDGDQVTVKGIFSEEANRELDLQLTSKSHYFNLGGGGVRSSSKEAMQSLYSLTLCLTADTDKMTNPKF